MSQWVSARGARVLLVSMSLSAPCLAQGYALRELAGSAPGETLGWAVALVGDVNRDGFDDFVVGAPGATVAGLPNAGRAAVRSGADGTVLHSFGGSECCGMLGLAVAGVGDADGDGTPDVALGAPDTLAGGEVRVYSGATGDLLHSLTSSTVQARFGFALAAAGDVDGDGAADLLVGAPQASPAGMVQAGEATVFSGASGQVLRRVAGSASFDHFGTAVAGGKDLDGDGVPDFAVGAVQPGNGPFVPVGPGYVRVYSGATGLPLAVLRGATAGDSFGAALALVGDVDGDGGADVLLGAPNALGQVGQASVVSGATGAVLLTLNGQPPADHLGFAVADAADVDGDGTSDFLVSAPTWGAGGRVLLISGNLEAVLLTASSPGLGDNFGYSVAGGGDVNGDGIPDLLVGAPFADPSLVSAAGAAVALSWAGIPAGSALFGAACAGSAGDTPRSSTSGGAPRSTGNAAFALQLSKARARSTAFLLLGVSNTSWLGVPLPIPLRALGLPQCSLQVSVEIVRPVATQGEGRAAFPLPIPAAPALSGQSLFAQWYVVDPGPALLPGAMTQGLQLRIQ